MAKVIKKTDKTRKGGGRKRKESDRIKKGWRRQSGEAGRGKVRKADGGKIKTGRKGKKKGKHAGR